MLATLGRPPGPGDDIAVEWKFDGQRAIVIVDSDGTRVFSRNGADVSRTFPELAGIADVVGGRPMILDGELVALDAAGRPSFTRLQRRWPQQRRPDRALLREVPVCLMGFDVLEIDGENLTGRSWVQRRDVLESVVVAKRSRLFTVPKAFTDVSPRTCSTWHRATGWRASSSNALTRRMFRDDPRFGQRFRSAPQSSW